MEILEAFDAIEATFAPRPAANDKHLSRLGKKTRMNGHQRQ
jgi:hypothetical protein